MPVPMAGFVVSLLTQLCHRSVTCLMCVHDWQVSDHVSTCHWPTPQNGKIKRSETSVIILSSLFPLSHVTHNSCVTNSHDSSHSRDIALMSLPHTSLQASTIPILTLTLLESLPSIKIGGRGAGDWGNTEEVIRHHAAASSTATILLSWVSSTLIFPFLRALVTSQLSSDNHGWFRGLWAQY